MPLTVLLILVVGGILGIALILHRAGLSQPLILTEAEARAGWVRHFPDQEVAQVLLTADGAAALIRTDQGAGLVWTMGQDTVARPLTGCRVSWRGDDLRIGFGDFGITDLTLTLEPDVRAAWQTVLEPA